MKNVVYSIGGKENKKKKRKLKMSCIIIKLTYFLGRTENTMY